MTEMAYGSVELLIRSSSFGWWKNIDKSVFTAILVLWYWIDTGLASSPPLAEKNGLAPFHYVYRQAIFGSLALL